MFYGRTREINIIKDTFKDTNTAIAIYGKRRVGKTTLIKEALKNNNYIYFECIEDTLQENLSVFMNAIAFKEDIPSYINFKSFVDAFNYLNTLNKRYIIVIDEFPYLKTMNNASVVDSIFQNIIDNSIKNLSLIISGSSMRMMQELFIEGNALFGRFKETILIEEFNYLESSLFYPNKSVFDKIAFYSVFGGSPFVNEMINPNISLRDNIINTFLKTSSSVYNYANNILFTDTANRLQAKRIVSALGNSKKRYSELESLLDIEKTGKINAALKSLCELGVVGKIYPINKMDDSKKAFYEITDNALRFFHTYVNKNISALTVLGADAFYDEYILPSLPTFISHQFEKIVRTYFSLKVKKGLLKGVSNIGTYYYDDSKTKTNGEFDVALKKSDGYEIYEVKYFKDIVTNEIITKELAQIAAIKELNITSVGFVSVYGFEEENEKYDYIDGKSLYESTLL